MWVWFRAEGQAAWGAIAGVLWQDGGVQVGRPVVRAVRAAAFTAVCVLASAALHVLVGGAAISLRALASAAVVTWLGAYAIGYRRCGRPVLLVLCGLSQYGLHQLFAGAELGWPAREHRPTSAMDAWAGHEHGGGTGMVMIHLAVALGSSWWLARGESALAELLRLAAVGVSGLWALLLAALAVLVDGRVAERPRRLPDRPEAAHRVSAVLTRALSRRGPPPVRLPCR
ncbi:hypothetical protein HII36_10960 [Nonomuraea sp. NN258]|uniref:hypothetical protein n=1 Tax=Nonomuraea antri TaxID=2730852 RepID=UPI001568FA6D|nr:hypothetical protein [Nonomuraea antri]NRQ32354.1 hypothetical protein [Nonomuraea antri]